VSSGHPAGVPGPQQLFSCSGDPQPPNWSSCPVSVSRLINCPGCPSATG
jgi:hypothetical protein